MVEHLDELEISNRCVICYETDDSTINLCKCSAKFHEQCLKKWNDVSNSCPACRNNILNNSLLDNNTLDDNNITEVRIVLTENEDRVIRIERGGNNSNRIDIYNTSDNMSSNSVFKDCVGYIYIILSILILWLLITIDRSKK